MVKKKEDVIRSRKSKERHYNGQKKEDVIRSRKSTEIHYNGKKKQRNSVQQNTTKTTLVGAVVLNPLTWWIS
jgi:hypothetical protein